MSHEFRVCAEIAGPVKFRRGRFSCRECRQSGHERHLPGTNDINKINPLALDRGRVPTLVLKPYKSTLTTQGFQCNFQYQHFDGPLINELNPETTGDGDDSENNTLGTSYRLHRGRERFGWRSALYEFRRHRYERRFELRVRDK